MLKIFDILILENFSLASYDIIDITPGSNSDFIRSLPNDAIHEMKQFGSSEQLVVADNVRELIVKFIKVYMVYSLSHCIYDQIIGYLKL